MSKWLSNHDILKKLKVFIDFLDLSGDANKFIRVNDTATGLTTASVTEDTTSINFTKDIICPVTANVNNTTSDAHVTGALTITGTLSTTTPDYLLGLDSSNQVIRVPTTVFSGETYAQYTVTLDSNGACTLSQLLGLPSITASDVGVYDIICRNANKFVFRLTLSVTYNGSAYTYSVSDAYAGNSAGLDSILLQRTTSTQAYFINVNSLPANGVTITLNSKKIVGF